LNCGLVRCGGQVAPVTRRTALAWLGWLASFAVAVPGSAQQTTPRRPFLAGPIWVYNNWSSYDELSDTVPLTEAGAMREVGNVLRLRRHGVRIDYFVMDAFWYDPDGGYRKWRSEGWPDGPDRWFAALQSNGIMPGLWFSTNTLTHMNPAPAWRNSLDSSGTAMAMYEGGFLADFMGALQYWYDHGVRLFKFDFADFAAAPLGFTKDIAPPEVRARNTAALREAFGAFRQSRPDAVLVAFNGFGGDFSMTAAASSAEEPIDPSWLDVFDSLYSGDPRPSDVPEMDFWRSVDIYSDHMVRQLEKSGIPLRRIDSTAFMIGDTGTDYHRKTEAWKGMLLLTLARGGWINTVHGNLELLDDIEARWFARAQQLYQPLQQAGATISFGGMPGDIEAYGFASERGDRALYAVVNPAQDIATVALPPRSREADPHGRGRVIFRDAGFEPTLGDDWIRLGPGQLAVIAFGRYASAVYDLGVQSDIRIPREIATRPAHFSPAAGHNAIEAVISPPFAGDLRIVMRQRDRDGGIVRSASEKNMAEIFRITAIQQGRALPIEIRFDRVVWSGLSWAVGEIRRDNIAPGAPIRVRLVSADADDVRLEGAVYAIRY